jgi:2-hydroxycyclohexanecarboxyl-CoA dehydrogenase
MQQAGYGRIVSIARGRARRLEGLGGLLGRQRGVIAFTKTIARENARFAITANAIAPGPIDTPLLRSAAELGEIGERAIDTMRGRPAAAPR